MKKLLYTMAMLIVALVTTNVMADDAGTPSAPASSGTGMSNDSTTAPGNNSMQPSSQAPNQASGVAPATTPSNSTPPPSSTPSY